MRYKETCACGAVMKVMSDDPMMFARAKGRWKLDHGDHSLQQLVTQRKRLIRELDQLTELVTDLQKKTEKQALELPIVAPAKKWRTYEIPPGVTPATNLPTSLSHSALEQNYPVTYPADDTVKAIFMANQAANEAAVQAMAAARVLEAKLFFGGFNEQGKQVQGEGDQGTTPPKRNVAGGWARRFGVGRGGGQR